MFVTVVLRSAATPMINGTIRRGSNAFVTKSHPALLCCMAPPSIAISIPELGACGWGHYRTTWARAWRVGVHGQWPQVCG